MSASKCNAPPPFTSRPRPLFIVVSGPSGAGKDTVLNRLKETGYPVDYVTTLTTRPPRAGEKAGVSYHFVSVEAFKRMVADNELLEWAEVYGNWYGVPRGPVKQLLENGRDVLIKVDVQGAATLRQTLPGAILIFVTPPSTTELSSRLRQRSSESPSELARRLGTADTEIGQLALFDYIVVNEPGKVDEAVATFKAVIVAEKHRVAPREIGL